MKFRSLILATVTALALASPGFAQTAPVPTQQSSKVSKPFGKVTIYAALHVVNEPNSTAKNFLNALIDKLNEQGATLHEGQAPVDAPNAFEFRVFLYSAEDGTANLTVVLLAHTQGKAYPEYLGGATVYFDSTKVGELVDNFVAHVAETFTNYLTAKNPSTNQ